MSYESRQRKRAIRRNQKHTAAREQFIALVVQKSKKGQATSADRREPQDRHLRTVDMAEGAKPPSPSTPIQVEREAA